jgi:hypothetical protein
MEALRETRRIESNQVIINVPDEFMAHEVEIIVLPIDEEKTATQYDRKTSFFEFVDKYRFKLPENYKFDREELYDR